MQYINNIIEVSLLSVLLNMALLLQPAAYYCHFCLVPRWHY